MASENINHGCITEWRWGMDNELLSEPYWTSCFLVDGLLIDAAAPASIQEFQDFLESIPEERKIKSCILTHGHEDHAGCAWFIHKKYGIPVFASDSAVSFLQEDHTYPDYRQFTWGEKLKKVEAKPTKMEVKTPGGKYSFQVFPMPGHAPCLIALIEPNQEWVFVGDAVLPKYKMIFGPETNITENIKEIYNSIVNFLSF